MRIPDLAPDSQGNLSMVWVLHMTKFITREDDYWKKSGRARIWMLIIPPSHYQQRSVGARWNLRSQLDLKSSVLTEGSTNFMWTGVNRYGNRLLSKHFGFLLLRLLLAVSSTHAHTPLAFPHTWATHAPHWKLRGCGHQGLVPPGLEVGISSF